MERVRQRAHAEAEHLAAEGEPELGQAVYERLAHPEALDELRRHGRQHQEPGLE